MDEAVVDEATVVGAVGVVSERYAVLLVGLRNTFVCASPLKSEINTLHKLNELKDLIKLLTVFSCVALRPQLICSLR